MKRVYSLITKTLILSLLTFSILYGQDTKKIKSAERNEEFYVLKAKKSIKHGTYKKFNFKKNLILTGQYNHNIKVGIWEAFDQNGNPMLKYDYDKKELLSYTPSKRNDFEFSLIDSRNQNSSNLVSPIILDGEATFLQNLAENIRYPTEALRRRITGQVFVSFVVDASGNVSHYSTSEGANALLTYEALRLVKSINGEWLPAKLNGISVDVIVTVPITFSML